MDQQSENYTSHHNDAIVSRLDEFITPFTLKVYSEAAKATGTSRIISRIVKFVKEAVRSAVTTSPNHGVFADWEHPLMFVNPSAGFYGSKGGKNPLETDIEAHLRELFAQYDFSKEIIDRVVKEAQSELQFIWGENSRQKTKGGILNLCSKPQQFDQQDWNRNMLISLSSYGMLKIVEVIENAPPNCVYSLMTGAMKNPELTQNQKRIAEIFASLCLQSLLKNQPVPDKSIEFLFALPPKLWAHGIFFFKGFANLMQVSDENAKVIQKIIHDSLTVDPAGAVSVTFNIAETFNINLEVAESLVSQIQESGDNPGFDLRQAIRKARIDKNSSSS